MLQRCYYPKSLEENPTYINCSVCDDWLTFSNFEKWVIEQGVEKIENCQLDKDLFSAEAKQYSPKTCCFLPNNLNTLIRRLRPHAHGLPSGVYRTDSGRFFTVYDNRKKYDSVEAALKSYAEQKCKIIQDTARIARNNNLITDRVYEALMNFKIL